MIDDFLLRALICGVVIAAIAGPLGSIVVWRRMAYFGDAVSHSAIAGVAVGSLVGSAIGIGVIPLFVVLFCLIVAMILARFETSAKLGPDSALGVLSPTALALGLILGNMIPSVRRQLSGYLFGDILAIGQNGIAVTLIAGAIMLLVLWIGWRQFVTVTAHPALAQIEGINIRRTQLVILLLLAIFVALALETTGALLTGALLVIPAVTVRHFCRSPESMAIAAAIAGATAVSLGIAISGLSDAPTGPAIVLTAGFLMVVSLAIRKLRGSY